jgi:hypothetical protein
MTDFFEGVGQGDAAGVWEDTPQEDRLPQEIRRPRRRIEKCVDGEAAGC